MKLDFDEAIVYIDDNSPEAKKIADGFDYELINRDVIVKNTSSGKEDKWKIKKEIKNAKTLQELQQILIKFIDII